MTQKNNFTQAIRFSIVGLCNTFVSYIAFAICIYAGLHYQLANIIGFFLGVLNAYIFSSRYVFYIHRDSVEEHLIAFLKTILSYSFTGILLNALFLYLLVDVSGVSCYKAQFFSLLITVPTNFILNKYWAFRK